MPAIPNRSEDLARPRERKGKHIVPVTKGVARATEIPEMDEDWHDIAKMLWNGMVTSGQADFYQNSDWAYAYSLCDDLSYYKKSGRRSSQMLAAINSAMGNLLITEGDRRRVRIELDPPADSLPEPASVAVMADYRAQLSVVKDEE